jgi:hypothetical protein
MQLSQAVARIEQKMDSYCAMSNDHDHFINGNGIEGAKVRIDRMEQVIFVGKWAIGIIGGVVITSVTGGALTLAVWWIRTSGH